MVHKKNIHFLIWLFVGIAVLMVATPFIANIKVTGHAGYNTCGTCISAANTFCGRSVQAPIGCTRCPDEGQKGSVCLTPPGSQCINDQCIVQETFNCNSNSDCASGYTCVSGTCEQSSTGSSSPEVCNDNQDNDADNRVDCLDSDCNNRQGRAGQCCQARTDCIGWAEAHSTSEYSCYTNVCVQGEQESPDDRERTDISGDYNQDGCVNNADIASLRSDFSTRLQSDVNQLNPWLWQVQENYGRCSR